MGYSAAAWERAMRMQDVILRAITRAGLPSSSKERASKHSHDGYQNREQRPQCFKQLEVSTTSPIGRSWRAASNRSRRCASSEM